MDADYDPNKARTTLMEEIKETLVKKRRNRKRKSKLAQLLATEKPKYHPDGEQGTYHQFMEEYYKMDCEDVIAGELPTKFKYREVVPNSFGLTIDEVSYSVLVKVIFTPSFQDWAFQTTQLKSYHYQYGCLSRKKGLSSPVVRSSFQ